MKNTTEITPTPLLDAIKEPQDLKGLSLQDLKKLSAEIRQHIIEVLSSTGGHLGSNLGSIELTLALHAVFNSPTDKFIWDVGHQSYTHKLITGRKELFPKIRQFKGLCGFTHPKESPHDHFHAGHAGAALSQALGVATTRDLIKQDEYVVPVIGDATLTCGVSLEALNNIPKDLKRFIVILNDNAMSISENVGAITHILSRLLNNPTTSKLQHDIGALIEKFPTCGAALSRQGHKLAESLKNMVSPAPFFEQYHLSYIGPVDGHDLGKLIATLDAVKHLDWPVVVHVMTKKGLGLQEALDKPNIYHGAKPFDKITGKFIGGAKKPTFPKLFGNHLLKMAEKDSSIVAVTPAMSLGSCLDPMMKAFPNRCIDVGIAESHSITFAGGLAHGKKMKVVASIYSTFLQRALDNLFHDVCLQELPVVFAIDRAGIAGGDGATHNGIYDIGFLNAMPNMVITQPRDGQLLKELMESAFSWGRPTAIRYPNLPTDEGEAPVKTRKLGRGELLAKGSDLLIVALGHMCETAMELQSRLKDYGVNASVLDPIFVKPLDTDLLCDLLTTHTKIVTIEEHSLSCGLGAILNHFLMQNGYQDVSVVNFGIPETFVEQGSHKELMNELGLSSDKILERIVLSFNYKKRTHESCSLSQSHQA